MIIWINGYASTQRLQATMQFYTGVHHIPFHTQLGNVAMIRCIIIHFNFICRLLVENPEKLLNNQEENRRSQFFHFS